MRESICSISSSLVRTECNWHALIGRVDVLRQLRKQIVGSVMLHRSKCIAFERVRQFRIFGVHALLKLYRNKCVESHFLNSSISDFADLSQVVSPQGKISLKRLVSWNAPGRSVTQ